METFLSNKVWFGKALVCQDCERKYYWSIIRGLRERETTVHLSRGAFIHSVVDLACVLRRERGLEDKQALGLAIVELSKADEYRDALAEDKTLLMLDDAWSKISKENVVQNELVVRHNVGGLEWWGLPDHIIQDDEGFWIGELKNTTAWGDRLRTMYYRDLQPWYYLDLVRREYPKFTPLRGVKLFVATPPIIPKGQKTPRIIPPEKMHLDPLKEMFLQEFFTATISRLSYLGGKGIDVNAFLKDRTRCISRTHDCPFIPLCDARTPSGIEETISLLYTCKDPMSHYYDKLEE